MIWPSRPCSQRLPFWGPLYVVRLKGNVETLLWEGYLRARDFKPLGERYQHPCRVIRLPQRHSQTSSRIPSATRAPDLIADRIKFVKSSFSGRVKSESASFFSFYPSFLKRICSSGTAKTHSCNILADCHIGGTDDQNLLF